MNIIVLFFGLIPDRMKPSSRRASRIIKGGTKADRNARHGSAHPRGAERIWLAMDGTVYRRRCGIRSYTSLAKDDDWYGKPVAVPVEDVEPQFPRYFHDACWFERNGEAMMDEIAQEWAATHRQIRQREYELLARIPEGADQRQLLPAWMTK